MQDVELDGQDHRDSEQTSGTRELVELRQQRALLEQRLEEAKTALHIQAVATRILEAPHRDDGGQD